MKTKIARQIRFNKMDRTYLDKVVNMLIDMHDIMIEDIYMDYEFDDASNIDMVDADTGEVIITREELEKIAITLGNLCGYIDENINENIEVKCYKVDESATI